MIVYLDTEIYSNYFLVAIRSEAGAIRTFEMFDGQDLDRATLTRALASHTVVTFNGGHFDLPILSIALVPGSTCAQIKGACDKIIQGGLKAWDIERQYGVSVPRIDHIDLIEVAPGIASLKAYGGRLHVRKLQDLPIAPDEEITPADRELIRTYCINDLEITAQLHAALVPQIELRAALGKQYGLDLRSKSDAQIAEAIISHEVATIKGSKVVRPRIKFGTAYKYRTPEWICFRTTPLANLLTDIQAADFTVGAGGGIEMPAVLKNREITIGASTYRLGIGGLHSTESCAAHRADAQTLLLDRDVRAYYPSIILRLGLSPTQMGTPFQTVYQSIVEKRVKAKQRAQEIATRIQVINAELAK